MDAERMQEITKDHPRISDKIRALHRAGVARSEIATFLGRRYQQVRNVIKDDERRAAKGSEAVISSRASGKPGKDVVAEADSHAVTRLAPGGIVEIPPLVIERVKLQEGDPLLVLTRGDEIVLLPRSAIVARLKREVSGRGGEVAALVEALAQG